MGVLRNAERAKQQLLFEGFYLPNTKITPTDCDAEIEYHDKAWVKIEVKGVDVPLQKGQKILLETFCKDIKNAGKRCLVMVVEHHVFNAGAPIFLKETTVRQLMEDGQMMWLEPIDRGLNTYDFVLQFIRNVDAGRSAFYKEKENNTIQRLYEMFGHDRVAVET